VSKTPAARLAPPDLPGYRFIEPVGAGGNAQVYLYEQELPRRKVAVKVLNESALSDAARRRFTAEANVTAGLAHRHIVQVFEASVTQDGRPYLVMPYYPQPNLSVRARRSHFLVADVLRIGIQIGSAVETSHRQDVLHRDIKPQNILTDSYGEPALTDFGIATTTGGDGPEGLSVPWSPPEILYGTGPGDQRADVYSLGATLWHLLAGRSPFEQPGGDNSALALMGRIKSDPPPRTQRADVPDSLERLLRQALAKDPAARPQSAMELIRGLQSVEQELRLPLTQPIVPAGAEPPHTVGGDTVARMRGGGGTETDWERGPGVAAMPTGSTQPGRGLGGGQDSAPADPWTHGGRHRAAPAAAGAPPPAAARAGAAEAGPGQPAWDAAPGAGFRDAPSAWRGPGVAPDRSAWPGGHAPAAPSAWGGAAAPPAEDDPTRARRPIRLDPWGGPAGAGRAGDGGSVRDRALPPPAPDMTTMARPAVLHQAPWPATAGSGGEQVTAGAHQGTPPSRPSRRVLLAGGGAALAVAVAAAAFFTFGRGSGTPGGTGQTQGAGQGSATGGATAACGQSALGPGATAPGQPTVTAEQAGSGQVRFSWTYANPVAGDSFRWQRVSGTAGGPGGVVGKPKLAVSLPPGETICIVVQARRAGGQASEPSTPACWPR